ncbi:hypothetical protein [Azospirillum doebereinerae]
MTRFQTLALSAALFAGLCAAAVPASARDEHKLFGIQDALTTPEALQQLDKGVKLYFGKQKTPKVTKTIGEWKTNKKTNAVGRSDQKACEWVFLSAVLALQERARQEGGNAVVGIKSNYKNIEQSSDTEYTCGAGTIMAGVALVGTVVTLGK